MKKIFECKKCRLYKNQLPLVEEERKNTDVMFLGISAIKIKEKNIKAPLASDTPTGKCIVLIENLANKICVKSNLVKCLPLDSENKVKIPTREEIKSCYCNFLYEVKIKKIKKVVLLGKDVIKGVLNIDAKFPSLKKIEDIDKEFYYKTIKKDGILYMLAHHPSYILKFKKEIREKYNNLLRDFIK